MPLGGKRLEHDGSDQLGGHLRERLVHVLGRAHKRMGSRQFPQESLAPFQRYPRFCWAALRNLRTPDEDDVMSLGRAIEVVDTQADRAGFEGFLVKLPHGAGRFEHEARRPEAPVGDPEGNRPGRDGNVHQDGRVDVQSQIPACQSRPLIRAKLLEDQVAAGGDGRQVAIGPRPAQSPADRTQRLARGRKPVGRGVTPAADERRRDQKKPQSVLPPRGIHDTRSPPKKNGLRLAAEGHGGKSRLESCRIESISSPRQRGEPWQAG